MIKIMTIEEIEKELTNCRNRISDIGTEFHSMGCYEIHKLMSDSWASLAKATIKIREIYKIKDETNK